MLSTYRYLSCQHLHFTDHHFQIADSVHTVHPMQVSTNKHSSHNFSTHNPCRGYLSNQHNNNNSNFTKLASKIVSSNKHLIPNCHQISNSNFSRSRNSIFKLLLNNSNSFSPRIEGLQHPFFRLHNHFSQECFNLLLSSSNDNDLNLNIKFYNSKAWITVRPQTKHITLHSHLCLQLYHLRQLFP